MKVWIVVDSLGRPMRVFSTLEAAKEYSCGGPAIEEWTVEEEV